MSSTNRGYERHKSDYYATPYWIIQECLDTLQFNPEKHKRILDPCAGGGVINGHRYLMSYPYVLRKNNFLNPLTIDCRQDSEALIKQDFLTWDNNELFFDLVITNPPFDIALEIAQKALQLVRHQKGKVVLLQRFNWLGSKARHPFFIESPPSTIVFHHKRPSFGGTSSTDSCEYAHFVWDTSKPADAKNIQLIYV